MNLEHEQITGNYRHNATASHKAFAGYGPARQFSGPDGKTDDKAPPANPRYRSVGDALFSQFEDLGEEGQDYSAPHPWSSYTGSRMLVRVFSRGFLGATLYTMAHRWIPGQLAGYSPEKVLNLKVLRTQPGQFVARGFDVMMGQPIKAFSKGFYRMMGKEGAELESLAENAVRFRTKKDFGDPMGMGRSFGAEVFGMTADFAAGSVGDATGRRITEIFDPNVHNSWERKDGTTDYGELAKSAGRDAFKIFTLNQGEDWFAAPMYVYQMRWQRQALNRAYKGFKATSDFQLNGGSFQLDQKGRIIDSYAKAGALDLQVRFTGYNWYTLMYRDMYNAIANHAQDGTMPSIDTSHGVVSGVAESIADTFRYITKSAIKATIYMTPAVPFFWITRTPQTKYKGIGIHLDDRMGIARLPNDAPFSYHNISENFKQDAGRNHYPLKHGEPLRVGHNPEYSLAAPDFGPNFDPFAKKHTRGMFDRAINPFGRACYQAADMANRGIRYAGITSVPKAAVHDWMNASFSYTPYMIAKAETALRWDRPKDADGMNDMDRAIYRMIDGVCSLNLGEVKAGFAGIREEIVHPDSSREIDKRNEEQLRAAALEKAQLANEAESTRATPDTKISTNHISTDARAPVSQSRGSQVDTLMRQRAKEEFLKDTDLNERTLH
ncbi:MAG: hypothetical protein CMM93_06395 [Rickettsiales bacterium]|nr:hypothetical protein [Rickettsiales bacterium]